MYATNWCYLLLVDHRLFEEYIDEYPHFLYRNKWATRFEEGKSIYDLYDHKFLHLELEQSENSVLLMEEY